MKSAKIIIRPENVSNFDSNLKYAVEIRKKINQLLPDAAINTLYPTKLHEVLALAKSDLIYFQKPCEMNLFYMAFFYAWLLI